MKQFVSAGTLKWRAAANGEIGGAPIGSDIYWWLVVGVVKALIVLGPTCDCLLGLCSVGASH